MNILVVGGTSGIGQAVATRLRTNGHIVNATGHGQDVRDMEMLRQLKLLKPEALVYSAGVNYLQWSQSLPPGEMLRLYDINVVGLLRVLQNAPDAQRVVVVGSDAAWRPMRTSAAYCASKAALHMLVKVIARERADEDFRINVVAPGMTDETGMQEYIDKRVLEVRDWTTSLALEYERSQQPLGRRALPYEIAEVVCEVLLTNTAYLNGAIIPVNGGR